MNNSEPTLHEMRHSAAHVLAQAVQQVFPEAKLAIGPVIDDGFYYDFELSRSLTPEDLTDLEKRMKVIVKERQSFEQRDLTRSETELKLSSQNQPYKQELVHDLNLETYSFYTNGPFEDLCRGPHVQHTGQIGAFKLLRVSGAYWKGSEKNTMLQRIYGTSFRHKAELKTYLTQLEQAKKRDHRVLGKALDLFSLQEDIGGGLVLWHPKGSRIRHIIETYWKERHFESGYELLYTPHVGKADLWETSGHLGFYDEGMYSPMDVEGQPYYLRPMNCPFHVMVYKNKQHSYRNLPVRYAELGTVYRYERSGTLHGLMRVRGFTQDDAHIICTTDQMHIEIVTVLDFCTDMLNVFGFEKVKIYLSTRPEEKYVGELDRWEKAEKALKDAIESRELPYEIDEGGGAFYGPKIDIKIEDTIGRSWQCSTVQFDFNLPERFDLTYIDSSGEKSRPFMIHRALFGSIERFFGILLEHYKGAFPFWLAPVQVKVLSLNKDVQSYCSEVAKHLESEGFRVETDFSEEKLGYKIRMAATEKVPFQVIVGRNEMADQMVSVRKRGEEGDLGQMNLENLVSCLRSA